MEMGTARQRERVSVKVGVVRAEPVADAPVPLCLVGLVPPEAPWYSDLFPHSKVRDTRNGQRDAAVEHLRFSGREDLSVLPSLRDRVPSRMLDAVRLASLAGAAYIDVLLARGRDTLPWELDRPELMELWSAVLETMHGAVLVFPDAGGPPVLGPVDPLAPEARVALVRRTLLAHAPGWTERYQIGLLDLPAGSSDALGELPSADAALCRWRGRADRLAAHGWRSAAAAVGGFLARPDLIMSQGVDGQRLPVGPGRPVQRSRRTLLLDEGGDVEARVEDEHSLDLHLDPEADLATVLGESTLRLPLLAWPLPAVRTLKIIHLRLMRAAEAFVFRPVQPLHAFALGVAVEQVIRPFAQTGLLVGPDGKGPPEIAGDLSRDPAAPGLIAIVAAQIRPWCRRVDIRVAVRGGDHAGVEVRV